MQFEMDGLEAGCGPKMKRNMAYWSLLEFWKIYAFERGSNRRLSPLKCFGIQQ